MPYDQNRDIRNGDNPGRLGFTIVPSDANDLAQYAGAIYVGVSGDITGTPITNADAANITLKAHPVGWCPMGFRKILATGTTATNLIGVD